jgi:hypothetical protein
MLLDSGYEVKVVSHSLGAGVAALLVADLKNGLFRRQQLRESLKESDGKMTLEQEMELLSDTKFAFLGLDYDNVHVQGVGGVSEEGLDPLPEVKAICYATPPCVGETLANAFIADNLVISMINGDDIVPRLSGRNIQNLADEIKSFASTAELWMKEDEYRMKRYAKSVGKEGQMGSSDVDVSAIVISASAAPVAAAAAAAAAPMEATSRAVFGVAERAGGDDDLPGERLQALPAAPLLSKLPFDRDSAGPGPGLEFDLSAPDRVRATSGISTPDVMVVPGKIAHFTKPRGVVRVSLCDYRVSTLSKISLLKDSIEEHHVSAHITALRSYKLAKNAVQRLAPPVWQKAYDEDTRQWARCSVCQSDPTWPFITNSDATRALVYHNCRACGKIVCVMCAPAGDSVPGSGIGEYQTLSDHRIPMPSLGILTPERACMRCYLHSFDH